MIRMASALALSLTACAAAQPCPALPDYDTGFVNELVRELNALPANSAPMIGQTELDFSRILATLNQKCGSA